MKKNFWTAATFKLPDSTVSENYKGKAWNQSSDLCSNTLKQISDIKEKAEKLWKKDESSLNNSKSTLSLHIVAYENSVATLFDSKAIKCESKKEIFTASKFVFQNPFEFPRQQNDKVTEPEVSQFRTSQRLFDSNETSMNGHQNAPVSQQQQFPPQISQNQPLHSVRGAQRLPPQSVPNVNPEMGEKADNESKAPRRIKKKYYKMVIRRLPFEMTDEELLQKLSPLPSHERFWFRKAEDYLEDDAYPYAFIVFDDFDVAAKFQRTYNGQLFADAEGNESTVIVEKAANQDFSKEPLKPIPGSAPITEDIGFLQFLEEAESKSITKKVDFDVLVNEITERERRHAEGICQETPLTDYLITKLHEKIVKNRPKSKKPEPKGAKIEKGETKPTKTFPKDKKEKPIRGGAREPKYRGDDSRAAETSEKKKRERPPRRIFENKKVQKDAASDNGENAVPSKEPPLKQNSPFPKLETKDEKITVKGNNTSAIKQDEKPKERKPVGPSQRNKDRPERAIYQPRPRGGRGNSKATPSSTTQNENVSSEQ